MVKNCITPAQEFTPAGFYEFTKVQLLDQACSARIRIYTTGRYILKINDKYICEGPCKGHSQTRYYDEIETDAFRPGENKITVRLLLVNDGSSFTSVFQSSKPELIFEAQVGVVRIVSDESWTCAFDQRFALLPQQWRSLPPYEKVDYEKSTVPLPIKTKMGFDFESGTVTNYGLTRGYALQPRPIPMIVPGEIVSLKIVKRGTDYIDLDAGCYVTAKLALKLKPNSDVKLIYGECYQTSEGKGLRDDTAGEIQGCFDAIHTGRESAVFSPFWFRSFRYIRIQTREPECYADAIQARLFHYPFGGEATFSCSNPDYSRMYEISVRTMQCCIQETFTDCPYYEQLQYLMDTAIESAIMLRMSSDTRMVRKCIGEFAASQLPNGLLQASYPSAKQQIIPGFCFFWVFLLRDYLEATADAAFVRQQIGIIDRLFCYFDENLSERGLITVSPYWDFVDWVSAWGKTGTPSLIPGEAHTIYNMYYACALLCAEEICKKLGRIGLSEEYRRRYDNLCDAIRTHCYDPERVLYRDGELSGGYSVHTIIWAVLSELETGENAIKMLSRIGEPELQPTSFAMNYYLFRAFEKCGHPEQIFQNLDGWKKMMDLHCSTWCENPDNPRSECHGWSCAPAYAFSSHLLGVKVGTEDQILIHPITADLSWAEGVVPTRFGPVSVAWKKEKGIFSVEIQSPEGVLKRLHLPDGTQCDFMQSHCVNQCKSINN